MNLLTLQLIFFALAMPLRLIALDRSTPSTLANLPTEAQASISAQLAKLTASDGAALDYLGYSAEVDGDTVVVGAPLATIGTNHIQGAVYVFLKPPTGWADITQVAKLTASDGTALNSLGLSVSVSGNTVVAGASGASRPPNCSQCRQGAVYVFVKPATGWVDMTETAKLTASDAVAFDGLGYSVAISGNTIVAGEVGDIFDGFGDRAAAYVFVKPVSGWRNLTQTAKLTASDHLASDAFGISVAISGNTIVTGAPNVTTAGISQLQGAAYVFVKPPGGWTDMTQTAKLTASHGSYAGYLGTSVSISGNTVVAGAPGSGASDGAAYVFVEPTSGWADMTETAKLTGGIFGDLLGYSVAISGKTVAAGAPRWPAYNGPGSAYVFVEPRNGWRSTSHFNARLTASDAAVNDYLGFSVGVSGGTVVAGAHGATIGSNAQQGAAYVFAPRNSYVSGRADGPAATPILSNTEQSKKQLRYRLVSFPTFGGPQSYLNLNGPTSQVVNNSGIVAGFADTSVPDPLCYIDDCLYPNAFRWQDGVLSNLGALSNSQWSATSWVSDTGLIAGESENGLIDPLIGLPEFRAVVWQDDQIIDLGTLSGGYESLVPVGNNSGQVVGLTTNGTPDPYSFLYNLIFGITTGTQTRAFVWDEHRGMQDLGTLGGPDAWATSVNNRGQIAGHSYITNSPGPSGIPQYDPFLWENGNMNDLGSLGGPTGYANALNDQGQVVGQMDTAEISVGIFLFHPYLWDKGTLTDLGTFYPPLGHGAANWINNTGEIVGWADDRLNDFPFLWKDGVKHNLGTVAGDFSAYANHINSKRQVVGSSHAIGGSAHAFLWEAGGPMIDLNTAIPPGPGIRLTSALFINDRGEIAVTGFVSNGDQRAFLLVPCAEGDQSCEADTASLAVITQDSSTSAAQHSPATTPLNPSFGARGMRDRPRTRHFHGLRTLSPGTNQ